jgi:nicotinamidase/pyrazinamidase
LALYTKASTKHSNWQFSKVYSLLKRIFNWAFIRGWFVLNRLYTLSKTDALIITDIQNDFLSGGALPVPDGEQVIPVLNTYAKVFVQFGGSVLASRDWHPANHMSFTRQGGRWPPHCIQETHGASFHKDLKLPEGTLVISKATDPKKEAYSVFDSTQLANDLDKLGVKRFFVGGLATDYCVLNTVLDSLKLGYKTVVLMDAIRGIDVNPGDVEKAVQTMIENGAEQATMASFSEPEDTLPLEESEPDQLAEKPSARALMRKNARSRPRGSAKRVQIER